jgi:hypothetical protein
MAREIFVSYSQPDRQCALELTEYLEANGLSVWIAPRDVSPAAEWAAEIIDAITSAHVMVLVFSGSSNGSPQVRREVERAVNKDLRILPFRIEEVQPSKSLEYFLSSNHWLDGFPAPREPHYARLVSALRQCLKHGDSTPAASPLAAAPLAAAPRPSEGSPTAFVRLSRSELRTVEGHLAKVIGPIARVLVERAASVALDLEDLERQVAAELDSSDDRRRFLEACQWSRRPPH